MRIVDASIAALSGVVIGIVANDFLVGFGIKISAFYFYLILAGFVLFAVVALWLAHAVGKYFLFVFQAAKYLLSGAFSTVLDLKIFELLYLFSSFVFTNGIFGAKAISFLVAAFGKYFINRYWVFRDASFDYQYSGAITSKVFSKLGSEKLAQKLSIKKEFPVFFIITLAGLAINISLFYFFAKIIGPVFFIPEAVWIKVSVLLAHFFSFLWNFTGYKFLVFER